MGIDTVIIPRFSSILSAYGIACADLTSEASSPFAADIVPDFGSTKIYGDLVQRIQALKVEAQRQLVDQGVQADLIEFSVTVSMHYDGSDTVLQIPFGLNLETDFTSAHLRETSFSMGRGVKIANLRVYAVGKTMSVQTEVFAPALKEAARQIVVPIPSESTAYSYFEVDGSVTRYQTPVYTLSNVPIGSHIKGPAIIVDSTQTIVVEPYAKAICLNEHVILQIDNTRTSSVMTSNTLTVDPIELAVFANRFMSIAE